MIEKIEDFIMTIIFIIGLILIIPFVIVLGTLFGLFLTIAILIESLGELF